MASWEFLGRASTFSYNFPFHVVCTAVPLSDDCHHSGSDSGSHCGVCGDLAIVACTASAVSGQVPAECTKDGILWLEDWTLYGCDSTYTSLQMYYIHSGNYE